ncbi:amidohydrolase [Porticoccus sp. W117]|uniref:amidohydrolase n=1 Tax=Porticoccus sp. W117 TaxID=3054777 RepID=UPI0025978181|nr:amidohydrolase [Porticoccus sp. W117]MDM3870212.1 amidohydrolase [Porticoccus sp. W117]
MNTPNKTFVKLLLSLLFPALACQAYAGEQRDLVSLYKHLHQNPELSFQEQQSAALLTDELRQLGFKVTPGVGGHGLVALLHNGDGPTVMVRADMDALPVKEQTGKPYASTKTVTDENGKTVHVMHACGHDVHMTVLVGTARQLVKDKDSWSGTLMMIGQPAEERGAGARAMLEEGLFERFPVPDYNLMMHADATLPAGKIGYTPEYGMANAQTATIRVKGIGGHGAIPQKTKDPVVLTAQIITGLQTIVSREISPLDPGVISVGSIHGGTKGNIIPDYVDLQLTIRSYRDDVHKQLTDAISRIAIGQAKSYGLPDELMPEITFRANYTPAVYNTPALTERLIPVLNNILSKDNVLEIPPVMAAEDFARYGRTKERIPTHMFWLGAVNPALYAEATKKGESLPSLHSPFFAPEPEPTLKTGVSAMTALVKELMEKK